MRSGRAVEKPHGGKAKKTDFPTVIGNPAKDAGFPLSRSTDDGYCFNSKPEKSRAKKTGHL
jgi:hypothetical protein